ncbi:MAG: hypothetical protein MO852_15165, partial [Candidatus Devosia euplotis]|nr:hypothetical protein [Candidatus Devosia euplotis]
MSPLVWGANLPKPPTQHLSVDGEGWGVVARRVVVNRTGPVLIVLLVIGLIWYAAAIPMNASWQERLNARAGLVDMPFAEFAAQTWSQDKPLLPAPHHVLGEIWQATIGADITSKRSLAFHAGVTLTSTLLGFVMGALLGVGLALVIVH